MKEIVYFLFIFILFSPMSSLAQRTYSLHGTLICLIATENDLVIVSDKRSINGATGEINDDYEKIYPVDKYTAVWCTGNGRLFQSVSPKKMIITYDPSLQLVKYLQENQFDLSVQGKGKIANYIISNFINYLKSTLPGSTPKGMDNLDRPFYELTIATYNPANKAWQAAKFELFYSINLGVEIASSNLSPLLLNNSRLWVDGNQAVLGSLNSHKELNVLLDDPIFLKIDRNSSYEGYITKNNAIEIAKRCIYYSSKYWYLIKGNQDNISKNVDVAVINKQTGFQWLEKNINSN